MNERRFEKEVVSTLIRGLWVPPSSEREHALDLNFWPAQEIGYLSRGFVTGLDVHFWTGIPESYFLPVRAIILPDGKRFNGGSSARFSYDKMLEFSFSFEGPGGEGMTLSALEQVCANEKVRVDSARLEQSRAGLIAGRRQLRMAPYVEAYRAAASALERMGAAAYCGPFPR